MPIRPAVRAIARLAMAVRGGSPNRFLALPRSRKQVRGHAVRNKPTKTGMTTAPMTQTVTKRTPCAVEDMIMMK